MSSLHLSTEIYQIDYFKPGKVVIFGNGYFVNGNNLPIMNDVKKIQETFKKLNFEIIRHLELTSLEILAAIDEIANLNFKNDSCFICFITTHGDKGDYLYGSDNKPVHISEFIEPIKKNISLQNKPKLFFIDACRGNKPIHFEKSLNILLKKNGKAQEEKDLLVGYATVENYISKMYETYGSVYIQKLCEIIEKNKSVEICQILVKVNGELSKEKFQVAEFKTTFIKEFYFEKIKSSSWHTV